MTWSGGTSTLVDHGNEGAPPPYVRDGCVRFVALGDSFTEGVGDEHPLERPIGWADRVAFGLATTPDAHSVEYANLAIRGRLLSSIAGPQLRTALALEPAPTLVAFSGGGNDIIRPRSSLRGLGHERAARQVLAELGVPGEALEVPAPPRVRATPLEHLEFFRVHVAPWMLRRLRGRSSGDGLPPKHSAWTSPTDRWTPLGSD